MPSEYATVHLSTVRSSEIVPRKLTDLEIGRGYHLTSIKPLTTRFGRRVLIVLEGKYNVWLPNRFSLLSDEQLEDISKADLLLVYKGISKLSKTAIINFEGFPEMELREIYFDMPIYAGFAILEISKVVMYGLHNQVMVPAFPTGTLKLQYTDTDSLLYYMTVEDAYQRLILLANDYLDTSTYGQDNVYGMPVVNKGVLGKLKGETRGRIITEFIGLRPKLYSFAVQGDGETLKAKGVKSSALRTLSLEDYRNCLTEETVVMREARSIKAVGFKLYTQKFNRVALCSIDDKSYIVPGTVKTLPWFHYSISEQPSTSFQETPIDAVPPSL